MKKILLITFLLLFSMGFAQQDTKGSIAEKSIKNVSSFPNPFNTKTNIRFYSNKSQKVIVTVKNLLGKTLFSQTYQTSVGNVSIPFHRENLTEGTYFYSVQTGDEIISKRLIIK